MMRRLLLVALALPLSSGCVAMKRDIQDLQMIMTEMRADQERRLREIQNQNETIIDSLRVQDIRMRGDFASQLVDIERQLVQIQELTGQGQQRLAELRESIRSTEDAIRRTEAAATAAAASAATAQVSDADPDELYASAGAALERGSLSTASLAFQEFVSSFPQHPRAARARLYLGEILDEEDDLPGALLEYERIVDLHPQAPEASASLLRAALIERQRGNTARARLLLNQITQEYPRSPEAANARDELRRMR